MRREHGFDRLRARPVASATVAVALVLASAALAVLLASEPILPASSASEVLPAPPNPATVPIRHIVVVDMENHAFDNYFGTYCATPGPYCDETANGIPPGTCVPLYPLDALAGCVRPYPVSQTGANISEPDIPHEYDASHVDFDGGRMDGYYLAEGTSLEPFGYYTAAQIPVYWNLAEQYALGDDFFSSALSYSLANHWYLIAGQTPSQAMSTQVVVNRGPHQPLVPLQSTYLSQANRTSTVVNLLLRAPSVTWKYYDYALAPYSAALKQLGAPGPFDYWNPLAAQAQSYSNPAIRSHLVNRLEFFNDTRNGSLPNVSWVIPAFYESDHPPANLRVGQAFVGSIVRAVEASPDWSSTALFVTWDDYGGYWDHVAPPIIDANGLSFRVPLLVISPYTPVGAIPHQLGYFESLLRFMEWRFSLGSLTSRDARAPIPLGYFDFQATPRPPLPLTTNLDSYPSAFQPLGAPGSPVDFRAQAAPGGGVDLRWATPVGGAAVAGYRLAYGPVGSAPTSQLVLDGSSVGLNLSGLDGGRGYAFSLSAFSGPSASAAVSASATAGPAAIGFPFSFPLAAAVGFSLAIGVAVAWIVRRARRSLR
jgi:phospholipase C